MIKQIKSILYFPLAYYFRFFAQIQLSIWKPTIIVVTGSSGKTTLLHLIESQLQKKAKYSHFANSSYGIPFDILGLKRTNLTLDEWLYLFLLAPFKAFKKPYKEKLYVVEADCDRPYEGRFLASLLKPNVTLWTSVGRTHSMNFDYLLINKKHPSIEDAIAHEFGYFLETTSNLAIVNSDSELIKKQLNRSKALVKQVTQRKLNSYRVFPDHTEFVIDKKRYAFNVLLPQEFFYSIEITNTLLDYLKITPHFPSSKFILPPGRCSLYKGIKNITIIDSTYNATPDGVKAILNMFNLYPSSKKWVVLGDMIELGDEEQEEHERLGELLMTMKLDNIILVGPRVSKYTYPKINPPAGGAETFTMPKEALDYLLENLKGGEVVLFKGARFLEGVIEHLLLDKNDVKKLCRREKVWEKRRKQWGL